MNDKDFTEIYMGAARVLPLTLITIKHPTFGEFRLTDDNIKHFFNGKEYLPYAYKIDFPDESDESDNSGSITMAKTDDRITAALRQGAMDITVRIDAEYLNSENEFVEIVNPMTFNIESPTISKINISASLELRNVVNDAFPALLMTVTTCPGIS